MPLCREAARARSQARRQGRQRSCVRAAGQQDGAWPAGAEDVRCSPTHRTETASAQRAALVSTPARCASSKHKAPLEAQHKGLSRASLHSDVPPRVRSAGRISLRRPCRMPRPRVALSGQRLAVCRERGPAGVSCGSCALSKSSPRVRAGGETAHGRRLFCQTLPVLPVSARWERGSARPACCGLEVVACLRARAHNVASDAARTPPEAPPSA